MRHNETRLSIIIPFFNEEDNVKPILAEIMRVQPGAEIIAVDDGSRDATWEKLGQVPSIIRGLKKTSGKAQQSMPACVRRREMFVC